MADLQATHPNGGDTATIGTVRLAPHDPGPVTSVSPYPGHDPDPALAALGLRFPAPGAISSAGTAHLVWTGRAQAFLMGAPAPEGLSSHAALTDQTDGWAWTHLSGADAAATLARLCPLDLRASAFPPGQAARSLIGHMQAIVIRGATDRFEIGVFRSMAGTLHHELADAARKLAARRLL